MLDIFKPRIEKVEFNNGVVIYVKELTAHEKDVLDSKVVRDYNTGEINLVDYRSKMLSYSLCDEKGERLFSDEDFIKIANLPDSVVSVLFDKARELNVIDKNFFLRSS